MATGHRDTLGTAISRIADNFDGDIDALFSKIPISINVFHSSYYKSVCSGSIGSARFVSHFEKASESKIIRDGLNRSRRTELLVLIVISNGRNFIPVSLLKCYFTTLEAKGLRVETHFVRLIRPSTGELLLGVRLLQLSVRDNPDEVAIAD